jgi:hypothetical protein
LNVAAAKINDFSLIQLKAAAIFFFNFSAKKRGITKSKEEILNFFFKKINASFLAP